MSEASAAKTDKFYGPPKKIDAKGDFVAKCRCFPCATGPAGADAGDEVILNRKERE